MTFLCPCNAKAARTTVKVNGSLNKKARQVIYWAGLGVFGCYHNLKKHRLRLVV